MGVKRVVMKYHKFQKHKFQLTYVSTNALFVTKVNDISGSSSIVIPNSIILKSFVILVTFTGKICKARLKFLCKFDT